MTVRRLAAILAADVVGSSRLIAEDETYALTAIRTILHDVLIATAAAHGGRLIKTMGDGALLEFASAVSAVTCAAAVQSAVTERAAAEPQHRKVLLRIGVNLGDVVALADGDLYGDGVNVAARLESVADPGGVAISANVHDELLGKLALPFVDLGERSLKNLVRPIRIYALAGSNPITRTARFSLPLPDKPSIAVLPFTNMSGDPEQDYFADGVVEDMITALSHVRWIFVIARDSSFAYKGQARDIRKIGEELGVRYILEGSIRKSRNQVRITGQLVMAETGRNLWADRFDGELSDIFDLQDRITASVISTIEPQILSAEIDRARVKSTFNLSAYDLYLRAMPHIYAYTKADFSEAEALLRRALDLDSGFSDAWTALSDCFARRTMAGWLESWDEGRDLACAASARAIAADPENGRALAMAACNAAMLAGRNDEALDLAERSLQLHPNSVHVRTNCAWVYIYEGRSDDAIRHLEVARRMNPVDPRDYLTFNALALAHLVAGRFEEVERWTRRALDMRPEFPGTLHFRGAALAHMGRLDEATATIKTLLTIQPNASIRRVARDGFRRSSDRAIVLEGLRKAGLPE